MKLTPDESADFDAAMDAGDVSALEEIRDRVTTRLEREYDARDIDWKETAEAEHQRDFIEAWKELDCSNEYDTAGIPHNDKEL